MNNITSYRITPTLYLTLFAMNTTAVVAKVVDTPTDHVFVIDVSGSMSGELPAIREHLKTRLATVLRPGDRFSLITYSGRGQCTRVLNGVNLKDASSLSGIQRAIDSYVRPIGMTAFVDALDELAKLAGELRVSRPNTAIAVIQMTDGQDNCYSRSQILAACDKLRGNIDSFDMVEYGMWTDRNLLTAMAERVGGSLTYVDGAESFVTLTERVVQKRVSSAKLRVLDVGESASIVFSLGDSTVNTYAISDGKVEVPDVPMTFAVLSLASSVGVGSVDLAKFAVQDARQNNYDDGTVGHAYAAVALLAMRSRPKEMYAILRALGDVALVNKLSTCFGKQAYTEASSMAQLAAFDTAARWSKGFDQNAVPRDDAFTLVDLVELLVREGAELDDANIRFSRIGPKRVDASSILTADEAADVKKRLDQAMQTLDVDSFAEVRTQIDTILASKGPAIKFVPTSDRAKISSAAWNQKEANLSITVRRPGYVNLGAIPSELFATTNLPHQSELARAGIPTQFETSIVRTRPLVASGIRNMDKIVVFGNERVWTTLVAEGIIDNVTAYEERMEIDLQRVPPCNMKMRDALSALHLVGLHHRLTKVNALIKAFDDAREAYLRTDWIVEKYGTEAATWLDSIGVKRYGFNPAQRGGAKSGDVRASRQMLVKIAGLSSLPTVDAVKKRFAEIAAHEKYEKEALDVALAAGKKPPKLKKAPTLTPSMELVADGLKANDAFLASAEYTSVTNKEGRDIVHTTWLDQRLEALEKEAEAIRIDVAKSTFTAIVGQGGFVEFADRELADTFELTAAKMPDGSVVDATIEFTTKEIEL